MDYVTLFTLLCTVFSTTTMYKYIRVLRIGMQELCADPCRRAREHYHDDGFTIQVPASIELENYMIQIKQSFSLTT